MSRICEEAEKQRSVRESDHRINQRFETISEAVAMSSMYTANHIGAKAICSLTETGGTCLWMSRISSGIPIFAFTRHTTTRRRVALYRGVYPMKFDITHTDPLEANKQMIDQLIEQNIVAEGDFVIDHRCHHLCCGYYSAIHIPCFFYETFLNWRKRCITNFHT